MMVNSVGAYVEGRPPCTPLREAVEAAELIDRIYARADSGEAAP